MKIKKKKSSEVKISDFSVHMNKCMYVCMYIELVLYFFFFLLAGTTLVVSKVSANFGRGLGCQSISQWVCMAAFFKLVQGTHQFTVG